MVIVWWYSVKIVGWQPVFCLHRCTFCCWFFFKKKERQGGGSQLISGDDQNILSYDRNSFLHVWFMWTSFWTYRTYVNPFETNANGRLFVVVISINWTTDRNKQTYIIHDTGKVTQLNFLYQKVLSGIVCLFTLFLSWTVDSTKRDGWLFTGWVETWWFYSEI